MTGLKLSAVLLCIYNFFLHSVIRRLNEHKEFFPAFFEVMNKLFEILGKTIEYHFKLAKPFKMGLGASVAQWVKH